MSKGNLFLGFGRGKLGDVVFSRQNGEQVARARNRSPRNPQTPLQLLQRVVMKSVSSAYSLMQGITDHSFQGLELGTPNQSRFVTRNVAMLRTRLADIINSGEASDIVSSTEANFNGREQMMPLVNAWIISEGHLPSIGLQLATVSDAAVFQLPFTGGTPAVAIPTYNELLTAWGLQRGDQLTFCAICHDDTGGADSDGAVINAFQYARIILDPANGDMTKPFLSAATNGVVSQPNARNEGTVSFVSSTAGLQVSGINGVLATSGRADSIVGMAVIVSRLQGTTWQRSTEQLLLKPSGTDGGTSFDYLTDLLGDAVLSYLSEAGSSLYLNQAQGGF